jgi:hypothetical protein
LHGLYRLKRQAWRRLRNWTVGMWRHLELYLLLLHCAHLARTKRAAAQSQYVVFNMWLALAQPSLVRLSASFRI